MHCETSRGLWIICYPKLDCRYTQPHHIPNSVLLGMIHILIIPQLYTTDGIVQWNHCGLKDRGSIHARYKTFCSHQCVQTASVACVKLTACSSQSRPRWSFTSVPAMRFPGEVIRYKANFTITEVRRFLTVVRYTVLDCTFGLCPWSQL